MLDIRFIRENPMAVKENIKKKFQEEKLPLVDQVLALDSENRAAMSEANELRAARNSLSKQVGMLMGQAKKDPSKLAEAEEAKAKVKANADRLAELEEKEARLAEEIRKIMLVIPNIIDPSVPIGPDDSANVEVERFGEPAVPDFEIPYHTEIMERFNGVDMDAAGRVSGNGFYYLMGNVARLHEAVLAYARDFMINKGFTFCIPPFMIHGNVVEGVMSQTDMEAMMYKIEGEDLYLIGTSEHSMIGKFIDQIIPEASLPQTLTSYSPCFRKEKGAQGLEGGVLHHKAVQPHPGGVVVVEDHKAPVGGFVHVGLDAEILCPVACGHKGGAGVLLLQAAQPAVGDHFGPSAVQFNGIHSAEPHFSFNITPGGRGTAPGRACFP